MKVTVINRKDGSVSVHKAGCRDVARTMNQERPFAEEFSSEFESKFAVWYDYNGDFLAEGSGAYDLDFLPCTEDLPAGEPMDEEKWSA